MRRLSPLLLVVLAACETPYADAVGTFAKTAADGTSELMKVRGSLVEACHQRYEYEYLVQAAERLELDEPLARTWLSATTKADEKCKDEGTTARGFELSVEALASYCAALAALAGAGKDLGDKTGKLGEKLGEVIPKLTGDANSAATIGAATSAAKVLVDALLRERRQEDLQAFVGEAEPHVRTITTNLEKYLTAARPRFDAASASRDELLKLVELPAKGPQAQKPDDASKPSGGDSRGVRYLRALAFFDLAHGLSAENRKTTATIEGYLGVVGKLRSAHSALLKASNDRKTTQYKDALKEITDLGQQLQELAGAFAGKKGK